MSGEYDDPEDFKKAALSDDPGVHRAVWDLRWEGAAKIKEWQDRHRRSRLSARVPCRAHTRCGSRSTARR